MEERKTEERFEIALRCLCERWGCFDVQNRVQRGLSPFEDEQTYEVLPSGIRRLWSELPWSLKSDIDRLGAVTAVKSRLCDEPKDEISLELAANNRLDLTIESLSLRPAWNGLFDEAERRTAAERLLQLMSLSLPNELLPSPDSDISRIVDYLNEQIISWETDQELPNSHVPYGQAWQVEAVEQTWCESVADSARAFDEIGLIRTSLKQCDHYFGCSKCAQAWPQLDRFFQQYQRNTFAICHGVLKVLQKCLARVNEQRSSNSFLDSEAIFWRVIVCAAGAMQNQSVWSVHIALSELESGNHFGPIIQDALAGIDLEEIDALALAGTVSELFMELQWFLYGNDDLIYLPSDGDLSEIPGAVVVMNSPRLDEWKRLMTGSDLLFKKRCNDDSEISLNMDVGILLGFLCKVADSRSQERRAALASVTEKSAQQPSDSGGKGTCLGVQGSTDHDLESTGREASREERKQITTSERVGPIIQSLADRMTGLSDMVASNSAAQVPIIDTLQDILKRMDGPSRYKAEQSIREALGDIVYNWLCPAARNAAIVAEYCWLDPNFPDPSKIVADLGTAFERQLRASIFETFCDGLKAAGVRNYPERSGCYTPQSDRPWPELPQLLVNGLISRQLTLGAMSKLLARPLASFSDFLERRHIDTERLRNIIPEVTAMRNDAVHVGLPSLREGASDIRRRWLGRVDGSPNIFAAIMPGDLRPIVG